ncbi:MAG: FAD:protein FMN transferase [Gammaproteobacteria bacterium]|nr:FAD:protein FMN transferase [Gammaproteobacteria bacterium]
MKSLRLFILLVVLQPLVAEAVWVDHRFPIMGTEIRVRFWLADEQKAEQAKQAVIDEMHHINNTMSPWIETSILSKVNRDAAKAPVIVSDEFFDVIERSITISELTQGAFDVTFSSVGYLYDYRAGQQPTADELKSKVDLINYKAIKLNAKDKSIRYLKDGVKIDLGGIAKGLAVDNSIKKLQSFGITEASVTAGGDTYVLGDNAGNMWRVGIRHPRAEKKLVTVLPVANEAVSTSGDYERYFIADNGERVHHIINPTTGKSVKGVQSVTIIAANSTYADALSTSVFVLGVEKGLALVNQLENVSAIIVNDEGKMLYSDDLTSM